MMVVTAMLESCAPTYDDIADKMLVETQKQADDGLLKLESLATTIESLGKLSDAQSKKSLEDVKSKASYISNMDFYNNLQSSITTLDARMTAMPGLSTPDVAVALSKIQANVGEVRTLHAKQNILSADYVRSARQLLDQQFKALTVYELTLKSGSKPH
jgi:hypothetical protein